MNIGFDAVNPWPYKDLIMENALLSDCISPPRHIASSLLFIWEGTKEVCLARLEEAGEGVRGARSPSLRRLSSAVGIERSCLS